MYILKCGLTRENTTAKREAISAAVSHDTDLDTEERKSTRDPICILLTETRSPPRCSGVARRGNPVAVKHSGYTGEERSFSRDYRVRHQKKASSIPRMEWICIQWPGEIGYRKETSAHSRSPRLLVRTYTRCPGRSGGISLVTKMTKPPSDEQRRKSTSPIGYCTAIGPGKVRLGAKEKFRRLPQSNLSDVWDDARGRGGSNSSYLADLTCTSVSTCARNCTTGEVPFNGAR